jgi:hypothetical protein
MAETWMKCAPTSGRFVEDIMKIVPVLDEIIEAKGGGVPDEFYRTGRRCRRVDDKGDCTLKPSVRQRKATLVARPYLLELAAVYASLIDPASARAGLKGGVMSEILKSALAFCLVENSKVAGVHRACEKSTSGPK